MGRRPLTALVAFAFVLVGMPLAPRPAAAAGTIGLTAAESRGLDRAHDMLIGAYVREIERERGRSIIPADADVLLRLGGEV